MSPRGAAQVLFGKVSYSGKLLSGKVSYCQALWAGRKEVLIMLFKTVLGERGLSNSPRAGTEPGVSLTLVSFGASLKIKVAFRKQN